MKHTAFPICRLFVLIALLSAAAVAQETSTDDPQTFEMTVSPAAEPTPALRLALMPRYAEKQPGNAATYYMRAMLIRSQIRNIDIQTLEEEERWLRWPLDKATQDDIRKWLAEQQIVFEEIRKAAYRDECDWGLRLQDLRGSESINLRLLEVGETRSLGRALRFQARIAIAEGRLDDALESLRQGYQLANDVSQQATLVNSLVGVAIASQMHSELQSLVQHENAPNLYWAIAAIPTPLIDTRAAIEQERNLVFQLFPALKDAENAEHTPDEWQQLLQETVSELSSISSSHGSSDHLANSLIMSTFAALRYPGAKKALIDAGLPAPKVEAMPVAQVILIHTARVTHYAYDEMFKWTYLPYADVQQHIAETHQRLWDRGHLAPNVRDSALPVAPLLLPAIESAIFAPIREQRRLAALQTIEAIRMYAAANGGMLPEQLSDITQVPLPRDPLSGMPPQYRRDGDAAFIDLPPRPGHPAAQEGYRYVLRIRE